VPASRKSVAELAEEVLNVLELGRNVAVHCSQGIGRSALIVGVFLVADGKDFQTALKVIEGSRGLKVPETEE
jgi:protein-tyrosine phosphatase